MRKSSVLLVTFVVVLLFVAPASGTDEDASQPRPYQQQPAASGMGVGARLGSLGGWFNLNFHASLDLTSQLEIEPAFDLMLHSLLSAGMISGTVKYNFPIDAPQLVPYAGAGLGYLFFFGYASDDFAGYDSLGGLFVIPFVGGVKYLLNESLHLSAELRPTLAIGEYGSGFSFGVQAGVTYFF